MRVDTPEPGPAKTLQHAVRAWLDDHYPYWRTLPQTLPDGLRLEMHPLVERLMWRDREVFTWGPPTVETLQSAFGVPVKVTTDLPDSTWRLAVVTEQVMLGGTITR
jgi:hypothetical protein